MTSEFHGFMLFCGRQGCLLLWTGVSSIRSKDHLAEKGVPFMDWRHRAACLTEDPELFFPVGNTGPALQQIEDAKKICQSCAVKDQCLNWALDAGQDHGVWGGTSEDERRAMKRRAARSRVRAG